MKRVRQHKEMTVLTAYGKSSARPMKHKMGKNKPPWALVSSRATLPKRIAKPKVINKRFDAVSLWVAVTPNPA